MSDPTLFGAAVGIFSLLFLGLILTVYEFRHGIADREAAKAARLRESNSGPRSLRKVA